MQVAISIQQGKVLPSFFLHKIGVHGRKTKLYKAFAELGRMKRTLFLLKYISDSEIGIKITRAITKIESFNNFSDWITFGGQTIKTGDPVEQDKRIKYTALIANAIMLNNVHDMTKIILKLRGEGYKITDEMLAHLSPYICSHIRRFGDFVLDLEQIPEPLNVKNIN